MIEGNRDGEMMRPAVMSRTQLRYLLSSDDKPVSYPALKRWEEENSIPKPLSFGNGNYSVEEVSKITGIPKEDIWIFLHDFSSHKKEQVS